jgi:lipoprotein-anchoring transpeptidase ErfK/SrfK
MGRSSAIALLLVVLSASACHQLPPHQVRQLQQTEATQTDTRPPADRPGEPEPEVLAEALPPAEDRELRIELGNQRFRYFEDDRLVRSGQISAGTQEHPTPTGDFRVLSKQKNKVSRSYTNYFDMPTPMPYSLQFYGPYFIHEGWLPGHPDSHGCVRLHYEDARFLFERMKRGDAIKITDAGYTEGWQSADASAPAPPGRQGEWLGLDDPRRSW